MRNYKEKRIYLGNGIRIWFWGGCAGKGTHLTVTDRLHQEYSKCDKRR